MFCGHCGYNNPNTSKFCLKCGSELAKYMPGGASAAAAATLRTPAQQQRPVQAPGAQMGMGAVGIWIAMLLDWAFRSVCFIIRFARGKWKEKKVI